MPIPYPIATIGTLVTIVAAVLLNYLGRRYIDRNYTDNRERYRLQKALITVLVVVAVAIVIVLWARLLQRTGIFLGIFGAGIAVALREPLLSIVARIAISAKGMYSVGDRIEIDLVKGDVIDVGFFYTTLMEVGGWIDADQVSGRIVLVPNSKVFGNAILNYTQSFSYIWDEIKLPVTYDSDVQEAAKILLEVGRNYTHEFLEGAEDQLLAMQRYFLVPQVELEPQVFLKITDNWVELTMRYVANPKRRRVASSFIYTQVFERIRGRTDITVASATMEIGIQQREKKRASGREDAAA